VFTLVEVVLHATLHWEWRKGIGRHGIESLAVGWLRLVLCRHLHLFPLQLLRLGLWLILLRWRLKSLRRRDEIEFFIQNIELFKRVLEVLALCFLGERLPLMFEVEILDFVSCLF
jgi:hypothetical protein